MSDEAALGLSSDEVVVATYEDLILYRDKISRMLNDYFLSSKDGTSDLHEMLFILHRRMKDPNFLTLFLKVHGVPIGFMMSEIVHGNVAFIIAGYLPSKLTTKPIIDRAMDIFNEWSKAHGCRTQKFCSYRIPGAHRFMLKRGWKHESTVYSKEMN